MRFKSRSKLVVHEAIYPMQKVGDDYDGFEIFRVKIDVKSSIDPNILNQMASILLRKDNPTR